MRTIVIVLRVSVLMGLLLGIGSMLQPPKAKTHYGRAVNQIGVPDANAACVAQWRCVGGHSCHFTGDPSTGCNAQGSTCTNCVI